MEPWFDELEEVRPTTFDWLFVVAGAIIFGLIGAVILSTIP